MYEFHMKLKIIIFQIDFVQNIFNIWGQVMFICDEYVGSWDMNFYSLFLIVYIMYGMSESTGPKLTVCEKQYG